MSERLPIRNGAWTRADTLVMLSTTPHYLNPSLSDPPCVAALSEADLSLSSTMAANILPQDITISNTLGAAFLGASAL